MASALFTESVLTSPGSVLPPRPDLNVSRSKYFPPSWMLAFACARVPQPLMPDVALALLPPSVASFSSRMTCAPQFAASIAAD
ncbi:hypothetical protein DQ04_27101000 [Trypanosoma grayi]|uniref:hypothetical protein n=1 Tax=Trypanosoma grayi TaxID=71804 RepID=UPI0004F40B2D|nr:hypothetical protein DQ04_27101000 [Trypanosoma grayi]KEG05133.1 hypothetical protein DQ04_27101000 [Trypanosoma grayi]